eukprot:TRINITY_DN8381_c1_g1_i1.p3 TRINITY_DN8381_c1_g1~~TRINITY_DN8381_c1_g1_i1.p3  ORF type:complete len:235 (+),score=79.57 TRINITY_DN8381_c1_g1_i1:77-706(+)
MRPLAALAALALAAAGSAQNASCPNVLVAYYSNSSVHWTRRLAKEVAHGAASTGAPTRLVSIQEATCDDVRWADAIALGSPVYWATIASPAKAWIERLQNDCFGWPLTQLRNKVGAAFCTGGHLSTGKDATMDAILTAWRAMEMIAVGCICTPQSPNCSCNPWGASATHADSSNATDLQPFEIDGGRSLGARMVEVAALMRAKPGCSPL